MNINGLFRGLCMLTLFGVSSVQAASIAIADLGFESIPPYSETGVGIFPGSAWIGSDINVYAINPSTAEFPGEAPEGLHVAAIGSPDKIAFQTLATTYQEGATYTLTAWVGDSLHHNLRDFKIGLTANGLSDVVAFSDLSVIPADGEFALVTATGIAGASVAGSQIEISLLAGNATLVVDPDATEGIFTGSDTGVYFDNVQLTVVPIPGAVWLFGSGLIGLVGMARRKKAA